MPGTFFQDWDNTWTAETVSGLNGSGTIAANTATPGTVQSNDGKTMTEIGLAVTFGATAADATLYILGDVDGTNFEAIADKPFGVTIPGTASTTVRRRICVLASASRFKISLFNPTGNSAITGTVYYRQAIGGTT